MPKKIKTTELTVEKDEPSELLYDPNHAPVLIVRAGVHMIETTATWRDSDAATWIRSALRETRNLNRRRSGPLIMSLCAFRGLRAGSWNVKGPQGHPNYLSNPYRVISICIAGRRVLFYRQGWPDNGTPNIKPLQDLFEDKKVVVVGLGIKETAKKLESQWGFKIAQPVDVRKVAANAYGKDAVYWPKREKGRVVIEDLGLEELGELVLDGMLLEKTPAKILERDWGNDQLDDEEEEQIIMYASRDAFLCYEIAAKCIEKTGWPSVQPSEN